MFSAADLIHALQRRLQLIAPHLRRPPGEFPPGWQAWFASMGERVGAVHGATSEAIVAVFLARPLALPPRRVGELTRWQAFATLWRQEWHGADLRDRVDRRVHWFSIAVTVLWHLFFGAMLLYLMYLRFMALSAPPPQGEEVVMVEYIGRGTPKEPGGGPTRPSTPTPERAPKPTSTPQAAAPTPSAQLAISPPTPPTPTVEAIVPDVAQRDVPEPQIPPPAPTVEQPVVVSEPSPSEPTVTFVLPPTRKRPPEPSVSAPELRSSAPSVRATDVAEPVQPIRRDLPTREIAAPSIEQPMREVTAREIPAPLPRAPVREVTAPQLPVPQVRTTTPEVRQAEIPSPPSPPAVPQPAPPSPAAPTPAPPTPAPPAAVAASAAPAPPSTTSAAPAPAVSAPSPSAPAATTPGRTAPNTAGAGPKPTPTPGTWSTPTRGDDWGQSTRERPGAQRGETPGIYNSEGRVRLAETPGSAAPAQPPGTITEEIKDLDRSGTWLKRKPTDFEPTSLDKYWVPRETLLAEWVRRGIKKVMIPIPGTGKRIECVVSMLQFGGGCGISDPDLNDQPAGARPPPNVPFKPALQEDNGSVKPL